MSIRIKKYAYLLLLIFGLINCPTNLFSINRPIDSLLLELKKAKEDTNKVNLLNQLSMMYESRDIEKTLLYAESALKLSEKLNYKTGIAWAYSNIGNFHWYSGNYVTTSEFYLKSLKIYEQLNDSSGIASCYRDIGWLNFNQNNYELALDYFFNALKIREKQKDLSSIGVLYSDIGVVFKSQKKYDLSLNYYQKSLKIKEERNDKEGIATTYGNIGILYQEKDDDIIAEKYLRKAILLYEELGDKNYLIAGYNNLGLALEAQKKYEEAIAYQNKTLEVSQSINFLEGIASAYDGLASAYGSSGDYKSAYTFHILFSKMKDSLLNKENSKQITEMQTKYETAKKDKELIKKDAEITKQEAEGKQRTTERNAFIIGFILMIALAFFVFRGYKQKQKANIAISIQKKIVEEKQKEILDSIHYAKRIQKSLLPTEKYMEKSFKRLKNGDN